MFDDLKPEDFAENRIPPELSQMLERNMQLHTSLRTFLIWQTMRAYVWSVMVLVVFFTSVVLSVGAILSANPSLGALSLLHLATAIVINSSAPGAIVNGATKKE